jgi:class 3 adenylate cyclase
LTGVGLWDMMGEMRAEVQSEVKLEENVSVECGLAVFGLANLTRHTWTLSMPETFSVLRPVFEYIYKRVTQRNGMIDTFSFNQVVAFFPRVYTENINLIVDSALDAAVEVMAWFYRQFRRSGPLAGVSGAIDLSVGIDAGIISIAHLRSAYHNEVLLLGKHVHFVARCLAAAEPAELLISQEALETAQYKGLYEAYLKPGPDIGALYHFNNDFYPTCRLDWENYASRSSWIVKE